MSTPITRMFDSTKRASAPPTPPRSAGIAGAAAGADDPYRQCIGAELTELKSSINALLAQHANDFNKNFPLGDIKIWSQIFSDALTILVREPRPAEVALRVTEIGRLILNLDVFHHITKDSFGHIDFYDLASEIVRIGNLRFKDYASNISGNPHATPPIIFAPLEGDGAFGVKIIKGNSIEDIARLLNYIITNPPACAQAPDVGSVKRKVSK